jgi:hypothetical protein
VFLWWLTTNINKMALTNLIDKKEEGLEWIEKNFLTILKELDKDNKESINIKKVKNELNKALSEIEYIIGIKITL